MVKRVLTALVLIPAVLLLILFAADYWLAIAAGGLALLAMHEYLNIARALGSRPFAALAMAVTVLIFALVYFAPVMFLLPLITAAAIAFLLTGMLTRPLRDAATDAAFSTLGVVYVAYSLTTLPLLGAMENGRALLLFLLFVVWSGDIAALFVGKAFGRHKLAPAISPGKTWEGFAGSLAGSLLVAAALFYAGSRVTLPKLGTDFYPGRLQHWLLLAALLNLAAQAGDLAESAMKRGAGIKDSGTLLPGHGGVLDRIDALLLAAPVLWYAQLVQQYPW